MYERNEPQSYDPKEKVTKHIREEKEEAVTVHLVQKKKEKNTKEKRKLNMENIQKEVKAIGEYSLEAGIDHKEINTRFDLCTAEKFL